MSRKLSRKDWDIMYQDTRTMFPYLHYFVADSWKDIGSIKIDNQEKDITAIFGELLILVYNYSPRIIIDIDGNSRTTIYGQEITERIDEKVGGWMGKTYTLFVDEFTLALKSKEVQLPSGLSYVKFDPIEDGAFIGRNKFSGERIKSFSTEDLKYTVKLTAEQYIGLDEKLESANS